VTGYMPRWFTCHIENEMAGKSSPYILINNNIISNNCNDKVVPKSESSLDAAASIKQMCFQ